MNRAYSASLGRWLSRDPISESGGINLYSYVMNNPIGRRGPLGLAYVTWQVTHPVIVSEDSVVGANGPQVPNIGYYWGGVGATSALDLQWFAGPSILDMIKGVEHYDDALMR